MEAKAFAAVFTVFFLSSCILAIEAISTSRSFISIKDGPSQHNSTNQGVLDIKNTGKLQIVDGEDKKDSMQSKIRNYDHPPAGNLRHDATTPPAVELKNKGKLQELEEDNEVTDYPDPGPDRPAA